VQSINVTNDQETIAAQATSVGCAGIGIIRISGKITPEVAKALINKLPKPRVATFCNFLTQEGFVIDQGLALYFKAPHSFTGEDVLELHAHGGKVVMEMLLQRVLQLGVRLARPGEFSQRAFLNNKIDLTQAEAIADLIEAESQEAARSAIRSLQGQFSEKIRNLVDQVINLRMYVEAALDFPEEDIDFLSEGKIDGHLQALLRALNSILERARQGRVLKEGLKVVIVGYPNAGKSSLFNRLSGEESAIVSETPGTTRDIIRETILIQGTSLSILDTAGLRLDVTSDPIEVEGIKRAWREIPQADRILLVIDAGNSSVTHLPQHPLVTQFSEFKEKVTIIRNKIDLTKEEEKIEYLTELDVALIHLSAKTGAGLRLLKSHLKECVVSEGSEHVFIARQRHLDALQKARRHVQQALEQLTIFNAAELVAEELREGQNALSEITGEFRSDDLLGRIFSSFCIGK
jgi:tRNA modification GTPase